MLSWVAVVAACTSLSTARALINQQCSFGDLASTTKVRTHWCATNMHVYNRALYKGSQRFHNHGEDPY